MHAAASAAAPTARRHADYAVRLSSVTKVYGAKGNAVHAPRGVTLDVPVGSFTAVMGPSGSGKAPCCKSRPGWTSRHQARSCSARRTSARSANGT
jgi:ABC-type transporter Mla maintaining outer membrane lipid asymmetry ATPase subunit MlaF